MLDLNVLHRPTSPEEAVRLFAETRGAGLYVGGGTIVLRAASPNLDFLVDLSSAGLSYVRSQAGQLVLGGAVTIAAVARSLEACGIASCVLHDAALSVATHTIRNLATVGGNLAGWAFPADLPVAFLSLDATVVMLDQSGRREVSVSDFYLKRKDVWKKGDLIVEVRVPVPPHKRSAGFTKIGRKRIDVALANAAASFVKRDGRVTEPRVAVGAVGGPPRRFSECESFLDGKESGPSVFAEAGRMAAAAVEPRADHRAGADYRRRAAGVAVERALLRAADLIPRR